MYIAGNVFDYFTTPKVMLALPVTFFLLFSMFPETPIYLLRNGKSHKAERSLKFLRGLKARDVLTGDIKGELQSMIRKVNIDAEQKRGSNLSGLRKKSLLFCRFIMIKADFIVHRFKGS